MISLIFSKSGQEDIALTEDDLFDFEFERGCFSGETFELGGVNAKSIYMIIDNNTQRFSRGTFANTRIRLDIDGHFCGYFNAELPKRRNGVIELTAYDDMVKLDVEYPDVYVFPQVFQSVYAQCVYEAGLTESFSLDSIVLNALFNNGVISHKYTEYIYANSCRNLVSGMAEWNGGFAYINDDNKLQVDVFGTAILKTFYSGDLLEFDYSDETVVFSKIKTSQKNKVYEMGDDSGYTLVINNQYISYGLEDDAFELYLGYIYDYYNGFSLTPMSFTLAEPDFDLKIGDRISVVDEEENVTVTGNISKIVVSGNCSMTVTCGGFGNIASTSNYNPTSYSQTSQAKIEAKSQAEILHTGTSAVSAVTQSGTTDGLILMINGDIAAKITAVGSGYGDGFEITDKNGYSAIRLHGQTQESAAISITNGPYTLFTATPESLDYVGNGTNSVQISLRGGVYIGSDDTSISIRHPAVGQIIFNSNGFQMQFGNGQTLSLDSTGLWVNGKFLGG